MAKPKKLHTQLKDSPLGKPVFEMDLSKAELQVMTLMAEATKTGVPLGQLPRLLSQLNFPPTGKTNLNITVLEKLLPQAIRKEAEQHCQKEGLNLNQLAQVNCEDNFLIFLARSAEVAIIDTLFHLFGDRWPENITAWWNAYSEKAYMPNTGGSHPLRVPLVRELLKALYHELRTS